jgi:colicin import membrane protein
MKRFGLIWLMLLAGCAAVPSVPAAPATTQIPRSLVRHDFDLHSRIYVALIQSAITLNWARPANVPVGIVCQVRIVQIPGGQVISVKVLPSCPFDGAGRQSVEAAVQRSSPLPYKGFEDVFQRDIIFNFMVEK